MRYDTDRRLRLRLHSVHPVHSVPRERLQYVIHICIRCARHAEPSPRESSVVGKVPSEERVRSGARHWLLGKLRRRANRGVQLVDEFPHGHREDIEVTRLNAAEI